MDMATAMDTGLTTDITNKVTDTIKKKILIVDDQPEVRELLATTLEISDYQILFAEDGTQAMTLARAEQPALILLDVVMPNSDLSGLEVCYRLKKDPATNDITIIMLSAQGQKRDVEAGMMAGADDYIFKPFSPLSLINKVDHVMWLRSKGSNDST